MCIRDRAGVEELPLQLPSQLLLKRLACRRFTPIGAIVYDPAAQEHHGTCSIKTSLRMLGPEYLLELDLRMLADVHEWGVLENISELGMCTNLGTLRLPSLVELVPLAGLHELKHLSFETTVPRGLVGHRVGGFGFARVTDHQREHSAQTPEHPLLDQLEHVGQLHSLEVNKCPGFKDLGPLTCALPKLRSLRLRGAAIDDVAPVLSLTDLVHLDLGINLCDSEDTSPVFALGGLVQLTHLDLSGHDLSNTEQVFSQLPRSLETLVVRNCVGFDRLDGCPCSLRVLDVAHEYHSGFPDQSRKEGRKLQADVESKWLVDISALKHCSELRKVDLSGRIRVKDVSCLAECTTLQEVGITNCFGLSDLSPLARLPALELVHLTWFGGGSAEQLDVSCLAGSSLQLHFGFVTSPSQLKQLAPYRKEVQQEKSVPACLSDWTYLQDQGCGDMLVDTSNWEAYDYDDYDYGYYDSEACRWNPTKLTRQLRKAAGEFVREHLPTHQISRPAEFTKAGGDREFISFVVSPQDEEEISVPVVVADGCGSEDTGGYECELCGFKGTFDAATACEASHSQILL
eukprot:TRINITY_DN27581_c0_g1_i3.p1 TRINITY_DN27581_c0_g1~~TRINITY_DN27581_c0_g1_i3.p1  ORF type:complete len:572 (+),score=90.81 TRINITY_DN27581_c0_g1_i3:69-1784(+)